MCREKSSKGKSINGLPMHAKRAHYIMCRKNCFISYVPISHIISLVLIDISVWTLKTCSGYYRSNAGTLKAVMLCRPVYCDTLWHGCTSVKEYYLIGKHSFVERYMVIPQNNIEGQIVVTGNISCLSLFSSYLSKRLLRRVLIHISVFVSLYKLR